MRVTLALLPVLLGALLVSAPAPAHAAGRDDVPSDLRPWIDWALEGHEVETCPLLPGDEAQRICAWPGPLDLRLSPEGGTFRQQWTLLAPSAVPLPGDAGRRPLDVTDDGRPVAVMDRGGKPVAFLDEGTHVLAGRFGPLGAIPQLNVPEEIGIVALTWMGRAVERPTRDESGRLVLAEAAATEAPEADELAIAVHRLVTDDVPVTIATRVLLEVSGSAREVLLGPVLPPATRLVSMQSPLPARMEPDGRLRVQVRAGTWTIVLSARTTSAPVESLQAPQGEAWPADESWSFQARPELRVVTVEDAPAIDPAQAAIPGDWRSFPAFRVSQGARVRFEIQQRGDENPSADAIAVQRRLWLDFDGRGMTAGDTLSGTLQRSWRLHAREPFQLGSAAVSGQDVLLTRLSQDHPIGFEIRQGTLSVQATSRIEGRPSRIPASGWSTDADRLSATLDLPPGWRLFHAQGVDAADGSWIDRWTLLDLFLALVVAAAALRLWGPAGGALALVTLALTIPEPGAPRWSWLVVLALAGIESLLHEGRTPRRVFTALRLLALGVVLVFLVPFAVLQARTALHPQLELPHAASFASGWSEDSYRMPGAAPQEMVADSDAPSRPRSLEILDPTEIIQTGPGLPTWTWRRHELRWSGPVAASQDMRLMLVPPWLTRLGSAASVLLLAALVLRALVPPGRGVRETLRRGAPPPPPAPPTPSAPSATAVTAAPLAIVLALLAGTTRAEIPSKETLDDLRARLLAPPPCGSDCASVTLLRVTSSGDELRLRLEIAAAARGVIALPGSPDAWMPASATLDGRGDASAFRTGGGALLALVEEGTHVVELSGPAGDRDALAIALPSRPARVEDGSAEWIVAPPPDGAPIAVLQLQRVREGGAREPAQQDAPGIAFGAANARVTRTLRLGITWEATTEVRLLAAHGEPVRLDVPLLPGESVTTPGVSVQDSRARVSLPPGTLETSWRSTLQPAETIELVAPSEGAGAPETWDWSEEWRVVASPRWHVEWSGIPPIRPQGMAEERVPSWRPLAGERLTLTFTRPAAVPGPWLTFESSKVQATPGLRVADHALDLALVASRGGEHALTLPDGASVQRVLADGLDLPVRSSGGRVTIGITPGRHAVRVEWRDAAVMDASYRTPRVDLGMPSVNPGIALQVPEHRWVLWTSGPLIGPAVLFWPLLAVLVLLALGLSRIRAVPLKPHDWVLLFVGLSQVPVVAGAIVVAWLLVLAWRRTRGPSAHALLFDVAQVLLAIGAILSVGVLYAAIHQGLLGQPDMQVAGNGSSGSFLQWTGDRAAGALPQGHVISAPLFVYRIAMLLWALWLAAALVRWMRWGWEAFTEGGIWKAGRPRARGAAAAPRAARGPGPPPDAAPVADRDPSAGPAGIP